MEILSILQRHPNWAQLLQLKKELLSRGYLCYLAGGCVRDAFLGQTATDLDVATDCKPEEIEKIFSKTVAVGKSFGVIRVLIEGVEFEVATFRSEGEYLDGRHPSAITYSTPQADAKRRDFTINALFFDLSTEKVIDEVGGLSDLNKKVIRTVGLPEDRFKEDYLRILRGLRFVAQLDFSLELKTQKAIALMIEKVREVSAERFQQEWIKLLRGGAVDRAFRLCAEVGFFKIYFPFTEPVVLWPFKEWIKSQKNLEDWQYLALFFTQMKLDYSSYQSLLSNLRLSRREVAALKSFYQSYHQGGLFLKKRLGQIVESFSKEGFYFGFEVFDFLNHKVDPFYGIKIDEIKKCWLGLQYRVPERLITGDDLKEVKDGRRMGEIINEAYWTQIENAWSHREQALAWLKRL
jgi:tRNA nucleotidyltransferase (CCA-adding enzyme)